MDLGPIKLQAESRGGAGEAVGPHTRRGDQFSALLDARLNVGDAVRAVARQAAERGAREAETFPPLLRQVLQQTPAKSDTYGSSCDTICDTTSDRDRTMIEVTDEAEKPVFRSSGRPPQCGRCRSGCSPSGGRERRARGRDLPATVTASVTANACKIRHLRVVL